MTLSAPMAVLNESNTSGEPGVAIRGLGPLVMLDLRLARNAPDTRAVEDAIGTTLPPPRSSGRCSDGAILRIGPDQWLLVGAPGSRWSEDLRLPGATLCDVSHGRVAFRMSGRHVRDALGKGCMLDLHPRSFPPGACAQTAIDKVPVILHRVPDAEEAYHLYAARSYAGAFRHSLVEAAREYTYTLST